MNFITEEAFNILAKEHHALLLRGEKLEKVVAAARYQLKDHPADTIMMLADAIAELNRENIVNREKLVRDFIDINTRCKKMERVIELIKSLLSEDNVKEDLAHFNCLHLLLEALADLDWK